MNEQQIRDALQALAAEPGAVDETSAWQQVQARIIADRARVRRRTVLAVAGLAAAGAAVAGVLVLAGAGDDPEAVEVGPAGSTTVPLVGFPEHPLAVVVDIDGAQRLDLYDADTGAPVTIGLARSVHSISDASITTDGTVYFTEEFGDSSTVRSVPWDGSADPVTPFGAEETDTSSPTLSPDRRTFGYLRQGPSTPAASIDLIDTRTGDRRSLAAPAGVSLADLEFSPGGNRLLVVVDGTPVVLDVDATSLDDAAPLTSEVEGFTESHWSAGDEVLVLTRCCPPDFTTSARFQSLTLDGPGVGFDAAGVVAFDAAADGTMALVSEDGSLSMHNGVRNEEQAVERDVPVEGRAVDVGY